MGVFKSIYEWRPWKQERKLEALPFEELQSSYAESPAGTFTEFTRRLQRLVFYAASEYLGRTQSETTREAIEEKVGRIFEEFSPEFASGEPQKVLLRFASVIRRQLDEESFRVIGPFFYKQLPTYHIADEEARIVLAATYQEALSSQTMPLAEILAERFNRSPEEIQKILQKANEELKRVIAQEFTRDELSDLTDGYLP